MSITIDHIAMPAHDHVASAQFFAQIMGVTYERPDRHFAPRLVSESFTLAVLHAEQVSVYHLGVHIGDDDFDGIVRRLQAAVVSYGNDPRDTTNMRTDHPFGGRGLFFVDSNGLLFEVMT